MAGYRHLDLDERRKLHRLIAVGKSVREAARELGRHVSTLYRELKRNCHFDEEPMFRGWFAVLANDKAKSRRMPGAKLARQPALAGYVVDRLSAGWSPEQIAGFMRLAGGAGPRVCHETIYQYVYGTDGRRQGLGRYLPSVRRSRRRRYARKPRGLKIAPENMIAARPPEIAARTSYGHWEGDLIVFRLAFGKANLTSLVERRSRFTVLTQNPSRHSSGVITGIDRQLRSLPPPLRRSITFDRGTEFAAFNRLRETLEMKTYFCQPSAPWQKGSVENSNGRIRRFLPLDTDIAHVSERELQALADRLNHTPRKCLGYRTPDDVLSEQIALCR